MSQYRLAFQNDLLVRQKRGFIFWWRWHFNRSEEATLVKLKNQIVTLNDQLNRARRLLPKQEADMKARKAALDQLIRQSSTSAGPIWRDSWTPRKEPVQLIENIKSAKKKRDQGKDRPIPDTEIARLVISPDANTKQRR